VGELPGKFARTGGLISEAGRAALFIVKGDGIMWTTKKRNKMLLVGMFSMILALGSWLIGCATFKIDEGSITEETVTLESVDLEALIAEYVRTWQPDKSGLGVITGPSEPGNEEIISLANEWGYTEDLSGPISITTVKEEDALPYPQARVSKFTATDKSKATREGVKILSWVTYPPVYTVSQVTEGQAVAGTKNLAIFLTEAEAEAYAEEIRPNVSTGVSINVGSYNPSKSLSCTLFKPL
jgi:hypothetical protein